MVDVLATALMRITQGPLLIGPLFAFVIAFSDLSLLGFGSFFWALLLGTGISLLLEREELRELQVETDE
jgi:benzoate membrane transport protein